MSLDGDFGPEGWQSFSSGGGRIRLFACPFLIGHINIRGLNKDNYQICGLEDRASSTSDMQCARHCVYFSAALRVCRSRPPANVSASSCSTSMRAARSALCMLSLTAWVVESTPKCGLLHFELPAWPYHVVFTLLSAKCRAHPREHASSMPQGWSWEPCWLLDFTAGPSMIRHDHPPDAFLMVQRELIPRLTRRCVST